MESAAISRAFSRASGSAASTSGESASPKAKSRPAMVTSAAGGAWPKSARARPRISSGISAWRIAARAGLRHEACGADVARRPGHRRVEEEDAVRGGDGVGVLGEELLDLDHLEARDERVEAARDREPGSVVGADRITQSEGQDFKATSPRASTSSTSRRHPTSARTKASFGLNTLARQGRRSLANATLSGAPRAGPLAPAPSRSPAPNARAAAASSPSRAATRPLKVFAGNAPAVSGASAATRSPSSSSRRSRARRSSGARPCPRPPERRGGLGK